MELPEEKNLDFFKKIKFLLEILIRAKIQKKYLNLDQKKRLFFHLNFFQELQEHNQWIFFHLKQT
jgi:hypothetical protein